MDTMLRSDEGGTVRPPIHGLPMMQRRIVETIDHYSRATGEPCPGRYLARRLSLSQTTIREHLSALHRKGWIRTPGAPVFLSRKLD